MNLEYGQSTLDVRHINHHLAIETTRAHQGRIEYIGPVGGGNDDHATIALKAIHLGEQLVEGLLPLVVAAADSGAALAAHGIDFIDENQTWAVFLGAFKQVAHPAGANAHEHFNELRTR